MNESYIAVIAAGGSALRCGGNVPKSLMLAGSVTYLDVTLDEVDAAGINNVLIYCNRSEYIENIRSISRRHRKAEIIIDSGVESTFCLVKHAASIRPKEQIIFLYGHSPRSSEHLKKMMATSSPIGVSLFNSSSKRKPMKWANHLYVEPPYKIRPSLLNLCEHSNWISFLECFKRSAEYFLIDAPAEFNDVDERDVFEAHLNSWLRCSTEPIV